MAGRPKLDRLLDALPPAGPAGAPECLVADYVGDQCAAVLVGEIALRYKLEAEPVHKVRVAVRRLRSTLRNFGPIFDPAVRGRARRRHG